MKQLVFIEDGRPVTDSLTVSEVFGKRHDRVLQDIRDLGCSDDFWFHNFVETLYQHPQNKQSYPKFFMTEQGFALLVMGYTGKQAMEFKEKYIQEFHAMREKIKSSNVVPLSKDQALVTVLRTTADLVEGQEKIIERIDTIERKVDEQITIDHGEQRALQKAVARKVYELEHDPRQRGELFRQLHREIKDRWGVASYRDVRRTELQQVIRYVDAWMPRKVS